MRAKGRRELHGQMGAGKCLLKTFRCINGLMAETVRGQEARGLTLLEKYTIRLRPSIVYALTPKCRENNCLKVFSIYAVNA